MLEAANLRRVALSIDFAAGAGKRGH